MKPIRRFTLSLAIASVLTLWFVSFDGVAAQRAGAHRTPKGYKVPVYGMSRVRDGEGSAGTECARLSTTQIERARLSRSVSRSLIAAAPRATVQAVAGGAFEIVYTDKPGSGFLDASKSGTDKIDVLTIGILEDIGYRIVPGAITARLPKR